MDIQIHHIYISPGHNYFGRHGKGSLNHEIVEVDEIECVAGSGIKGDRFFDYKPDYKGQITFFNWEVYEAVKKEIAKKDFSPSAFRRNVIVSGIDLNDLIEQTFTIDNVTFLGTCEAKPCYWMDEAVGPGTEEFLKGQGGLRAKILKSGSLSLSSEAVG